MDPKAQTVLCAKVRTRPNDRANPHAPVWTVLRWLKVLISVTTVLYHRRSQDDIGLRIGAFANHNGRCECVAVAERTGRLYARLT